MSPAQLCCVLFTLILPVTAHIALWDPAMYGWDASDPNQSEPVLPLMNLAFKDWWFHGYINKPPADNTFMSLPAGGTYHGQVACNKALTTYGQNADQQTGIYACDGDGASGGIGAMHTSDAWGSSNPQDVKGCGIAIAYESDVSKIQPEDFAVISVNHTCPWFKHVDFQIPSDLPACPEGGCHCMWGWVHSADAGSEQNYFLGYRCNVTGATGVTPLPAAKTANKCDYPTDTSNCTVGAKQPHYWFQNERNNNPQGTYDPPFYNGAYGFMDGAQTDLFAAAGSADASTSVSASTSSTVASASASSSSVVGSTSSAVESASSVSSVVESASSVASSEAVSTTAAAAESTTAEVAETTSTSEAEASSVTDTTASASSSSADGAPAAPAAPSAPSAPAAPAAPAAPSAPSAPAAPVAPGAESASATSDAASANATTTSQAVIGAVQAVSTSQVTMTRTTTMHWYSVPTAASSAVANSTGESVSVVGNSTLPANSTSVESNSTFPANSTSLGSNSTLPIAAVDTNSTSSSNSTIVPHPNNSPTALLSATDGSNTTEITTAGSCKLRKRGIGGKRRHTIRRRERGRTIKRAVGGVSGVVAGA
ncbi:hypothetical protein IAT38_004479 [Cryptococcus sp. DSM 104549]